MIINALLDAFIKGYFTGRVLNGAEINKCLDACIITYKDTELSKQMEEAANAKRKEVADALWAQFKDNKK